MNKNVLYFIHLSLPGVFQKTSNMLSVYCYLPRCGGLKSGKYWLLAFQNGCDTLIQNGHSNLQDYTA